MAMKWLDDIIQRVLGQVEKEYPGYTNQLMMDAAGPMGEPHADPRQYDPPFRVPLGSGLTERDLENPRNEGYRTMANVPLAQGATPLVRRDQGTREAALAELIAQAKFEAEQARISKYRDAQGRAIPEDQFFDRGGRK
jgi:hypothetical protein